MEKTIKYIVATHSPHILGSVTSENIFILYRDENGKIEAKTGDETLFFLWTACW